MAIGFSLEELRVHYNRVEVFVKERPLEAVSMLRSLLESDFALRQHLRSVEEKRSNNAEWWLTYRAALTGIYSHDTVANTQHRHEAAAKAATAAHGPLQEIPEYPR